VTTGRRRGQAALERRSEIGERRDPGDRRRRERVGVDARAGQPYRVQARLERAVDVAVEAVADHHGGADRVAEQGERVAEDGRVRLAAPEVSGDDDGVEVPREARGGELLPLEA
jgi:hypothetical protein